MAAAQEDSPEIQVLTEAEAQELCANVDTYVLAQEQKEDCGITNDAGSGTTSPGPTVPSSVCCIQSIYVPRCSTYVCTGEWNISDTQSISVTSVQKRRR